MTNDQSSTTDGFEFGVNEAGVCVMKINQPAIEVEHLGEVIDLLLTHPDTEAEVRAGVRTNQRAMGEHARNLVERYGYPHSHREAWLSEHKEEVRKMAIYIQGLIEAAPRGYIAAAFLANLCGYEIVPIKKTEEKENG